MYYRRKIVLSLIEIFGGELQKMQLQKLLLLLSKQQEKPAYDFVPYKYGCFSFQAKADLHTMVKYSLVSKTDKGWKKEAEKKYMSELKGDDHRLLLELKKNYKTASVQDLLEITYRQYPYYAINSTIMDDVLAPEDQKKVPVYDHKPAEKRLFTIGYEGISLEAYLNKLIRNGVKALIDVRKNAMSMKYGFSKSQLKRACEGVHIQYLHFSEVGIQSSKRKDLKTQKDYDSLFEDYKQTILPETTETQKEILDIFQQYGRVALTCFEAESCQCHRRPLAEYMMKHSEFTFEPIHL